MEEIMKWISDWRQLILPALILAGLAAVVYVIVNIFRSADREINF